MYPLELCDHLGLIHTKSWVCTRKSEIRRESCSTPYSTQKNESFSNMYPLLLCNHWGRGWSLRNKGKKHKDFSFLFCTQSKARAGWPTRLRLVRATPWADFAVITVQLWSTMTTIFSSMNNFSFNCYLRPRSWNYYQIFKTTYLLLLNSGLFPFSLSEMLWDTYLRVFVQRFEPGGFIEQRRFRIIFP